MDKYIIKITRKRNKSCGNEEEIHYYNSSINNTYGSGYFLRRNSIDAKKFTIQELEKIIEGIKRKYKINPDNGKLLKIEVLNSETLEIVDINKPVRKVSRFEIMEI